VVIQSSLYVLSLNDRAKKWCIATVFGRRFPAVAQDKGTAYENETSFMQLVGFY
jgi:hypothetical protein